MRASEQVEGGKCHAQGKCFTLLEGHRLLSQIVNKMTIAQLRLVNWSVSAWATPARSHRHGILSQTP